MAKTPGSVGDSIQDWFIVLTPFNHDHNNTAVIQCTVCLETMLMLPRKYIVKHKCYNLPGYRVVKCSECGAEDFTRNMVGDDDLYHTGCRETTTYDPELLNITVTIEVNNNINVTRAVPTPRIGDDFQPNIRPIYANPWRTLLELTNEIISRDNPMEIRNALSAINTYRR